MRTPLLLATVLALLTISVAVSAQETKLNPFEKLDTAIPKGIELLEKKQFVEFLSNFITPDELAEVKKTMTLKQLAEGFGKHKGERMLKIFKEIKGTKPVLSKDGATASYKLKAAVDNKSEITFIKINKVWHVKN